MTKLEMLEEELKFLEMINPKYCGCDRCPSCNIIWKQRVEKIKNRIKFLKGN